MASTTTNCLPTKPITSTASKTSGTKPSASCANKEVKESARAIKELTKTNDAAILAELIMERA